eukprot:TRINITY_DN16440_c1_g1_i2.p1 TRINITY_DN16440_c1_g1~~TRINITY_DN16440_c1_g1_i2.p1  ORF type:complete len:353 (+),score=132.13 TRINITY_DN16440_c1_g1_i2:118-1176(+)
MAQRRDLQSRLAFGEVALNTAGQRMVNGPPKPTVHVSAVAGGGGRMASTSATVPFPSGLQGDSQPERMQRSATHQPIVPAAAPARKHRVDLECLDYVDDIFRCIRRDEMKHLPRPGDMAAKQVEVTADMRGICLDWIIECANRLKMEPATIFLAANVLDRFLATKAIRRERMQMVSMVSLIIAAKYEEIYPPRIKDYIHISANHFTREDMLRYEHYILHALGYSLTVPTPYNFISRLLFALKDSGRPETREQQEVRHASLFIAECAMLKLSLYLDVKPSRLAAGSVFAARQMLGRHPVWPSEVAGVCEYDAHAVSETAAVLLAQAREVRDGRLKATVARYAEGARSAVSRRL